jgi:S-adenosylmethionine:tRNA ribosyltransferase-isomerase
MVRPAKRLREGEVLDLEGGAIRARAVRRDSDDDGRPGPEWIFELVDATDAKRTLDESLEQFGRMPLPPYIERGADASALSQEDREAYQTIFARESGAVAAPTAGLHFTEELLGLLSERGVELAAITLHVGPGTFLPVTTERILEHRMHAETYRVEEHVASAYRQARSRGARVVAVGTTSARALESACDESGVLRPSSGETRLFVTPGYRFRAVDALFTNFHLPRSTLLMLVSAFAGRERVLELYADAIVRGYRFYSYGDAMLFLGASRSGGRCAPRGGFES